MKWTILFLLLVTGCSEQGVLERCAKVCNAQGEKFKAAEPCACSGDLKFVAKPESEGMK